MLFASVMIFVLATFLGVQLINRVPTILHTPLMSGANAISGITVVGALLAAGSGAGWVSRALGFLAIVFAMINVVGGYAVTDRMLRMFRKRPEEPRPSTAIGSGMASSAGLKDIATLQGVYQVADRATMEAVVNSGGRIRAVVR
jgi:H+-translocating NAD(P) transhydrogenase subunit alpha